MIFAACPKPFTEPHIAMIQRNAIRSWLALTPRPTVVLFGGETGVREICAEFGVTHAPTVACNRHGTPLVDDVFHRAQDMGGDDSICYVNADIVLTDAFTRAVDRCRRRGGRWLMGGRPWDLAIDAPLAMDDGWQERVRSDARQRGALRWMGACDYFVFPRGLWDDLPPFAVGRCYFDLALLYLARRRGADLIDATEAVTAIHQSHGYAPHLSDDQYTTNAEALENVRLAGGWSCIYTWRNATHVIAGDRIQRSWPGTLRRWGHFSPRKLTLERTVWYPALAASKPLRRLFGLDRGRLMSWSARVRALVGGRTAQ